MKILCVVGLAIACLAVPSSAITGLGFGIHGGQTMGYSYDALDNQLGQIADLIGLPDELTFEEDLLTLGAHVKVGTLPIIDFYGFLDYSWKTKEITPELDFRVSDLAAGVSAKKAFGVAVFKPFAGLGFSVHRLVYSLETDQDQIGGVDVSILPIPEDQNKLGFHVLAGVELNFPVFPIDPYAQIRYNWITTEDKTTKYALLEFGLTFSL